MFFFVDVAGSQNSYQWFKDGVIIDGATGDSLTFVDLSALDNGNYHCEISSALVENLTLFSKVYSINVVGTAPTTPQNINAVAGNQEIEFSWSANTEEDFNRYVLYMGTSENAESAIDSILDISTNSYLASGLINGQTYFFRMRAVNDAGLYSEYSNEVSSTPFELILPPASPQNVNATVGDQEIEFAWSANTEEDFNRYVLYMGTSENTETAIDSIFEINTNNYLASGLLNDQTYYFRMRAVNDAGLYSEFSTEISATPADLIPPAAPTALTAVAGDQSIQLSWTVNSEK